MARPRMYGGGVIMIDDSTPLIFGKWLYSIRTAEGKLFRDEDECTAAEESGDWVDSPAKSPAHKYYKGDVKIEPEVCPDFIDGKCSRHEVEEPIDPDYGMTSEMLSKPPVVIVDEPVEITPVTVPKPSYRKYPATMNKPELIAEAAKYGLDFSDGKSTNNKMRIAIRKAKK